MTSDHDPSCTNRKESTQRAKHLSVLTLYLQSEIICFPQEFGAENKWLLFAGGGRRSSVVRARQDPALSSSF